MGLRPFISIPKNLREWSKYLDEVDITVPETSVENLVDDLAAKVPNTRQVLSGTGLSGGGALSVDRTLSFADIANNTLLGNVAGSAAPPISLTYAQVLALMGQVTAVKGTDTTITSSTALTADPHLAVTVETASYAFELFLAFYEVTLGTGGFQFDVASGTATISSILWAAEGYLTAAVANPAATSATTTQNYATIATSSSAPSWVRVTGEVSFGSSGTFAMRWAQNSSSANGTTLKAKSYLSARKL